MNKEHPLKNTPEKLREIALDIKEPGRTQGQMDHDSKRIEKEADKIEQFVTGHGTGEA